MLAKEMELRFSTDDGILSFMAQNKVAVPIKGSFRDLAVCREVQDGTGHGIGHGPDAVIIVIEDGIIVFVLIEENSLFRSTVGFHRVMTVQMVRRDIEDNRRLGLHRTRKFELET